MPTLFPSLTCGELVPHLGLVLEEQSRVHIEIEIEPKEELYLSLIQLGAGDAADLGVEGVVVILVIGVLDREEQSG